MSVEVPERHDEISVAALRAQLRNDRKQALGAALDIARGSFGDELTQEKSDHLEVALSRVDLLDTRLERLQKVEIVREPDLYERDSEHSFFRDLVSSAEFSPLRVSGAEERLDRHQAYEAARAERRDGKKAKELRDAGISYVAGSSERALSTLAAGTGGAFVPPKFMLDQFASAARAAAPLRQLMVNLPLPAGTMQVFLPRMTSVVGVLSPMQVENITPPQTVSATDQITANVATFAGDLLLSQELYDRSNFDQFATEDFAESYAASLQSQLINGPGGQGQILGLLNVSSSPVNGVPGAIVKTYTDSTPTPGKVVQAIAQTAAGVSDIRLRPPTFALMNGSRHFWIAGTPDSTGVPIERPGTGLVPQNHDTGPFGPIAGLPVFLDGTIPITNGEDVVIVGRGSDMILMEDEPRFSVITEAAGGSAELSVFLVFHNYATAFTNRYPSGIGSVTGTGFTVQSGW